ncbi:hypothetical protein MA03_02250 [Infirmifilum uzonense]|jgi:hypothetical protein|uniref:Uncharacterized protein n=2 Tax=Thermofilaceae TaxID=114378 RepID=A0A0F7FGJ4_9CREN|nr:hypothetical protein MA03_02250 [Infirmifilum uzonense]
MPLISFLTGLLMVIIVFLVALYSALTYQRVPPLTDLTQGIGTLATEGLYLLGKIAFLSVALAAGVQLLKHGLSTGRSEYVA